MSELYPIIKTANEVNEMVENKINESLKAERLNHMKKEEENLENLLRRYEGIKKHWGKADSIVKIIGTVIAFLSGISLILTTTLGGFGFIPLATLTIIDSILLSTTTLSSFTTVFVSMRYTKRKKKAFRARVKLIEEYKNKVFYFMQKAREDGIITIDELKQFDSLIAEFKNKLLEIKKFS